MQTKDINGIFEVVNKSTYKELFSNIIKSKVDRYGFNAVGLLYQIKSIEIDEGFEVISYNKSPEETYKEIIEVFDQLKII